MELKARGFLVSGFWLLAFGFWLLAFGFWRYVTKFSAFVLNDEMKH
ncbi:hypothetical protein [Cyclonatronum proteinivorum]|nr:hypothetical protein [Cyclonatronum proteinivorum]